MNLHFDSLSQQSGTLGDDGVAFAEARLHDILLAVVQTEDLDRRRLRASVDHLVDKDAV